MRLFYRWRFLGNRSGGGLIIALSASDAMRELSEKYPDDGFEVWRWENDDYYDANHPYIFNLYD